MESLLDRDTFTLEELLDEDELIQECKSLNTRLINFLRGKSQIEQLVRYVVEEPLEGAENKRVFKFPFIACEIFTCEIEVIIKTMVEDEELMGLLFSFLHPDRPHGTLLAGYFSKVVICLLMRKTAAVMRYLQAHQEILKKLVDLIAITSITEVLIRLVGADDNIRTFHEDSLHWLADTDLLEMLVDKLSPPNSSEAHANAAEALSAVSRLGQSALATKLSSPSFIGRLFHHALEDPDSKSTLVHSLTVCISLLDPKKFVSVSMSRGQHMTESLSTANPETIEGMLQRLGDLLNLLDVSSDERALPTTYGELRPPLGTHRLKIVEFLAVLLRTNSEGARQELVRLGAIQTVLTLFFEYPFNNLLHHHVENIVTSCIESNNKMLIDHLLVDCDLVARLLRADEDPFIPDTQTKPTVPTSGKVRPRIGNIGHLTRIANRLVQVGNNQPDIQAHLQANSKWAEWQSVVLPRRNMVENVYQWACGRPTSVQDRPIDSDDDEFRDKDYDISTMASDLTREVFRYGMFDNEVADEVHGANERDDDDVFFDDESAEVVISSLRLGEEQDSGRLKDSIFTSPNWFAFQDDRPKQSMGSFLVSSPSSRLEDGQGSNNVSSPNSSSSDDEVVVGEDDELADTATSDNTPATGPTAGLENGPSQNGLEVGVVKLESGVEPIEDLVLGMGNVEISNNLSFFQDEQIHGDIFCARPPDWASWKEPSSLEGTSGRTAFSNNNPFKYETESQVETIDLSSSMSVPGLEGELEVDDVTEPSSAICLEETEHSVGGDQMPAPLFEGTVQFVGVEIEGTAKAMEHALREGIVGEAGPLHPVKHASQGDVEPTTDAVDDLDFGDVNYWRSDYSQSVTEVEST